MLAAAGIVLTPHERETIEVAEHRRPWVGGERGKEATFRVRSRDESDLFTDPRIRR